MKRSVAMLAISAGIALLLVFSYYLLDNKSFAQSVSDEKYLPSLLKEINSAKYSIRVIMFESRMYNQANSSANQIQQSLAEARARGVDVKVIMEGGEGFLGQDFAEYQQRSCDFLSSNNVPVRFDPVGITTHAKLVVIDNHRVLIGSTNWNYNALEKNHETDALIESAELAGEFNDYFNSLWEDSVECYNRTI